MTWREETGGSAFPNSSVNTGGQWGMTLRDYLASKAMEKILELWPHADAEWRANKAYTEAEAMIERRNRPFENIDE